MSATGLVLIPPGTLDESLVAILALVGLLPGMGPLVCLHVALLDKGLRAEAALEVALSQVDLLVPLSRRVPAELFPTIAAPGLVETLVIPEVELNVLFPNLLMADFTFHSLRKEESLNYVCFYLMKLLHHLPAS